MTVTNVASGVTLSGAVLQSGDSVNIAAGGIMSGGVIGNGSVVTVNGGYITRATLDGGIINVGNTLNATRYLSFTGLGGTLNLTSGYSDPRAWTFVNNVTCNVGSGALLVDGTVRLGGNVALNGGTASKLTLDGGTLDISTPGSAMTSAVFTSNGGTVNLHSGYNGTLGGVWGPLTNGVVFNVDLGATVAKLNIGAGAIVNLQGSGNALTLDGGALIIGSTGAVAPAPTYTAAGGTVSLLSGYTAGSTVWALPAAVTLNVASGASLGTATVSSGATISASAGATINGNITVVPGGTIVLNNNGGSGSVLLDGEGARLTIMGGAMPTVTISGFTGSDQIRFASIPPESIQAVTRSYQGILLTTRDGGTYFVKALGALDDGYRLMSDGQGGTIYTTCFAEGTLIRTPGGEKRVELLVPGDLVSTARGPMPVKWVGSGTVVVSERPQPENEWLVRFNAGSLAEGVPSRDLRVTQEHCLVFEDALVPARMLVNGCSVILDRSIPSYRYYHFELDEHEAIWAEDTPAETYLDSGNRPQFHVTLGAPGQCDLGRSQFRVDTSRAFVEPLYRRLIERIGAAAPTIPTHCDPDLRLVFEDGTIGYPYSLKNNTYSFAIPDNSKSVFIVSRTFRPSESIGPFIDDRRSLGVLIDNIELDTMLGIQNIETPFSNEELPGWDILEKTRCRWTKGAAILPLDNFPSVRGRLLRIRLLTAGPYRDMEKDSDRNSAAEVASLVRTAAGA